MATERAGLKERAGRKVKARAGASHGARDGVRNLSGSSASVGPESAS